MCGVQYFLSSFVTIINPIIRVVKKNLWVIEELLDYF